MPFFGDETTRELMLLAVRSAPEGMDALTAYDLVADGVIIMKKPDHVEVNVVAGHWVLSMLEVKKAFKWLLRHGLIEPTPWYKVVVSNLRDTDKFRITPEGENELIKWYTILARFGTGPLYKAGEKPEVDPES
ncbi:MAG TPA: hypothetical protein VGE59_02505 [Patescibacteria group bacterium]